MSVAIDETVERYKFYLKNFVSDAIRDMPKEDKLECKRGKYSLTFRFPPNHFKEMLEEVIFLEGLGPTYGCFGLKPYGWNLIPTKVHSEGKIDFDLFKDKESDFK